MDRLTPVHENSLGTWHALLDGVECDVARTENWLITALTNNGGGDGAGDRPDLGPMPDLDGMQPLPSELLPRIAQLRARMLRVSVDLERAMAANRRQRAALPSGRPAAPGRPAQFVDRAL